LGDPADGELLIAGGRRPKEPRNVLAAIRKLHTTWRHR